MRQSFVLVFGALLAAAYTGCGSPVSEKSKTSSDAGSEPSPSALLADAGRGPASDAASDDVSPKLTADAEVIGLLGSGLVLRTASGQEITVRGDGVVALSPPIPTDSAMLTVVTQPVAPSQTCAAQLSAGRLRVSCATKAYTLGGQATGLRGSGLVLTNATSGASLPIAASGTFAFPQPLPESASYDVRVTVQPSAPRQQCTLTGGQGRIAGADASLAIDCATQSFTVGGNVAGLRGSGLTLTLQAAGKSEARTLDADGKFVFSALPDETAYTVKIEKQPSQPDQQCTVVQGAGHLAGASVSDVAVVCGALGGLRINEVGTCNYLDSACWIELANVGTQAEQLSYHSLRTTARMQPTNARQATYTFQLPELQLAPGTYVVVRAKSSSALPDGSGVVHVGGDALPWWDANGFAELLSSAGTVDFVRWGTSTVKATSAKDEWLFSGESAASLPSQYGFSIARDRDSTDDGDHGDWTLRAFATPGGPNDVDSDADLDNDGVPDVSEKPGGTFAGINVYAMGARTGKRDLFLEIDRMTSPDPAVIPRKEALQKLVDVFAKHGIALHADVGSLYAPSFSPADFNLGGGSEVPFNKTVGIGIESSTGSADIYDLKAAHMASPRRSLFYYMLFGSSQRADGGPGSSGIGEVRGNDSIITLGGINLNANNPTSRNILVNFQALTMMHELGHNLGLSHGGGDSLNRKPNYLSVMNYLYSYGLPSVGNKEGDRYYLEPKCALLQYINQLSNSPLSDPASFVIDYSEGLGADLYEASVYEKEGLGHAGSKSVDFNCNQNDDAAPYVQDLNADGRKSDVFEDHDDWSALDFVFRRTVGGSANGPNYFLFSLVSTQPEEPRDDLLIDDVQEVVDEPCPVLRVPN